MHAVIINVKIDVLYSLFFDISGVSQFAGKTKTVAKWVLSRPFQEKFLESLFDICGKSRMMSNPRKCLLISEIKRSNAMVEKVINVIVITSPTRLKKI